MFFNLYPKFHNDNGRPIIIYKHSKLKTDIKTINSVYQLSQTVTKKPVLRFLKKCQHHSMSV